MKYAHYFKSGKTHELMITDTPRVNPFSKKIVVSGKREARQYAKEHNAKPYNF